MKFIKNLKIKTQEGFEVKNLQRYPSMEFGPEGGMTAHLYYLGAYVAEIIQEGNGGCACVYLSDIGKDHLDEIKHQALHFLQRVDRGYGPQSQYEWLKNKTANKINDDDFEAIVTNIEERYEDIKTAQKAFKQGYKTVVALYGDFQKSYLYYQVDDVTSEEVLDFLIKKKKIKEYPEYRIISCKDNLLVF